MPWPGSRSMQLMLACWAPHGTWGWVLKARSVFVLRVPCPSLLVQQHLPEIYVNACIVDLWTLATTGTLMLVLLFFAFPLQVSAVNDGGNSNFSIREIHFEHSSAYLKHQVKINIEALVNNFSSWILFVQDYELYPTVYGSMSHSRTALSKMIAVSHM